MEGAVRRLWGSREEQEQRAHRLQHRNMNMKQEGPFLVPQLWKDTMSLENITNDFLDSNNVTGEVMNLDDFLKELQVNELVEHAEASRRQQVDQDPRTFQPLIRPANIEALKEQQQQSGGPGPAPRPSVMQHVGKAPELHSTSRGAPELHSTSRGAPELHVLQSPHTQHAPHLDHMGGEGGLPPHHRELALPALAPKEQGHLGGIPQASVRPHVRAQVTHESRVEQEQDREDSEHAHTAKRMRKMSEVDSVFSGDDDDDEEESRSGHGNFGGFTSTVCVNFSQDDLRLATIPGQEGDFDPATRRFSEEELKPQPIIRKRKKQFVPDELKNNKYWAKRYKNNEAAKRSREARRLKENQIAMRARFLEEENTALKGEVDHLKKENSDLKHMTLALEDKLNSMIDSH